MPSHSDMGRTSTPARRTRPFRRALVPALFTLALGACATMREEPTDLPGAGRRVEFNTGRLQVFVVDQYGQAVQGARIDVDADQPDFYRNSGTLDWRGSVTFNSVPPAVRVTVNHPRGYFSAPFLVPPDRTSEMRMIVNLEDVFVPLPQPQPAPDPRNPPRRPP